MSDPDLEELAITEYPVVVWLRSVHELEGDVVAYLCRSATVEGPWVFVASDGWLFDDSGRNEREYFDRLAQLAIPADRVQFIEWRRGQAAGDRPPR